MRNFLNNSLKSGKLPKRLAGAGSHFPKLALLLGLAILGQFSASAQCSLNCRGSVEINLPSRSNYTVTVADLLTDNGQACPNGNFRVRLFNSSGTNIGNKVNYNHIGETFLAEVTDLNTTTTCSVNLDVVDNEKPVITAQDLYVVCSDSILPRHIGYPDVRDNVSLMDSSDLNYSDAFTAFGCFTEIGDSTVTGQVERTWFAVDDYGNVGTKVQHIYYVRKTIGDVVFPENRDGFEKPYLLCQRDNVNDLAKTGSPTINGNSIYTFNNCEFSVTYTDQTSVVCGGETRTLRRWNVIDWCTDSSRTVVQVIRVRDVQAPTVVAPDTLFINTSGGSCTASVTLPNAVVTDSCSATTVTKIWDFGTGNGPFHNVPVGTHAVTYRASDQCGNTTNATAYVVVRDNEIPTAVCDVTKEISLLSTGEASVFAIAFNDGSHDNCGIDKFEVSRDNEPFSDKVSFSCTDIGNVVRVTMKVSDINGFTNTCEVSVQTADYLKPSITCPTPITIGCKDDYTDLNLVGEATGDDNCTVASITHTDNVQLNQCGIGNVVRTWQVTDNSGNFSTCKQILTLEDDTPLSISFPVDYETFECGASTMPSETGQPVITGDDCESVEVTYFDQTFQTSYPACYKILRRWTVVDWCAYTGPNGNNQGIWTGDQTIKISDNEAPQLFLPDNITIGASNTSCSGLVTLAPASAQDCSNNVSITNNSPYAISGGADASGSYPVGTHVVKFTAFDGCGNTTSGNVTITVVDDKPPTPVCNRGITISLNSDGEVYLTPAIIAQTAFDNCASLQNIRLEISPSTFTCGDLGEQDVTLHALDPAGNRGTCVTQVQVQDQLGICNAANNKASLGGRLETMGGTFANQVLVELSGGLTMGRQTNVDGTYLFENLPKHDNYSIRPIYNVDPKKEISTLDLVIIQKHILNVELFTTPYQWIAADANKSGTVTTLDMVVLRKLVLNVSNDLPNNTSWRFVDASYEFPEDITPLQAPFPEQIYISDLSFNRLNNHFVAIKVGDVNGSAKLNTANGTVQQRSEWPELLFETEEIELRKGQHYEVAIQATENVNLSGMQFTLSAKAGIARIQNVETGALPGFSEENVGTNEAMMGNRTISWGSTKSEVISKGDKVLYVELLALENGKLSEALEINSDWTEAEAYVGETELTFAQPKLIFAGKAGQTFQVYNQPNPFNEMTSIYFETESEGPVTLKLLDLNGRLIYQNEQFFDAGTQQWMIGEEQLNGANGIIIYQLQYAGGQLHTGKMIRAYH